MYQDAYDDGWAEGYRDATLDYSRVLEEMAELLDEALGECTHLADQIDLLKAQLNLTTRDDLE